MKQDGFDLDGAVAAVMGGAPKPAQSPESTWLDAAVERIMGLPEPTFGEQVLSAGQGAVAGLAGAAKTVFSDVPREAALAGTGVLADVLGRQRPTEESILPWDPATQIGKGLQSGIEGVTPDNPLLSGGAPFRYSEMAGQTAPTLLLMLVDPVLAQVIGATQTSGATMGDARAGGASPLATLGAGAAGYLAGGALTGGVATAIENISARGGGILARNLERAAVGGGTGVALPVMTNAIHNWATDDEIPLLQNAAEDGIFGAAVGALIGAATEGALAMRARTGRRMTGQGWDGALMPEDTLLEPQAGHAEALEEGARATREQFQATPQAAQIEGARLAERMAAAPAPEPYTPVGTSRNAAERRNPLKPGDQTPFDHADVGEPIYDSVTGAYMGNQPVEPKVASPIGGKRTEPPRTYRDIMRTPESGDVTSVDQPVWNSVRGEYEMPGAPQVDVNTRRPAAVEQGQGAPPDSSALESTQTGTPGIGARAGVAYAPETRPDYSRLANPVTDTLTGRTIVTDVGTPTNPSTGLRVTTADTYGARGTMLRTDVVRSIQTAAQKLGAFIVRTGLVPEGASGLYDPATREARIARYGDVVAAAHEAGHAIELAAFGRNGAPDRSPGWKGMEPELVRLGKQLYPDSTPHNGHVSEGFAEFQRLWLLQHEDLMRIAPETTKWFDTTFLEANPEFRSALIGAREAADQYRFQGSAKRTQTIDPTSWSMRFRTSSIGEAFAAFKRSWIDTAEPLYAMTRAAAEAGAVFEKGTRALDVFVGKRATTDSILSRAIHDETINARREHTGDPLKAVLSPIRGKRSEFNSYLALRAAQWRNESKTVRDLETGARVPAAEPIPFLSVDVEHQLADFEARHPEFRGTADAALAWYDRILSYAAEHDPVLAQSVETMRQEGEFYMPLHRWVDWYESKVQRPSTGNKRAAALGKLAERSSGSKREIVDPLTSLVQEARRAIERAHERAVQNAVIQNALEANLVGFVSDVTNRVRPMLEESTPFRPGEAYAMPLEQWGAMQVWSTGTIQHADGPIVPFKRATTLSDGTPGFELRYYQFDPKLHESIMSMDPNQAMQAIGFLGTTLRFFKGTFVLGAVGLNASFGMLKNPIRDAQTLYVNSRNSPHLASLIPQLAYEHARVFAHQVTAGKVPYQWVDAYDRIGLDKSDFHATFQSAAGVARGITRGGISRVINLDTPAAFVRALAHVMQASEKATRIWELKGTAKKVGWELGTAMSPEQVVAMAVDAKQATIDFNAGGTAAQQINRIVPFFNVAIQGPRTYLRAAKEAPGTFALRNAALMGLGAVLWYRHKDEDWMQAMPAAERMRYWYFPLEGQGGERILARIPLSQEVALPVKAMEFFLDALHSKDPYTAEQYIGAVAQMLSPGGTNPLVDEVVRQATNRRDYFQQGQLVNEANKHKPVEEQVNARTGPLSVWIGETFHLSPVRVDSVLRNTLGGVGSSAADSTVFGLLKGRVNKSVEASDTTLIGALARKGGPVTMQSRNISNLYDLAEVANRNAPVKVDAESVTRKMLLDNTTKVVSLGYALLEAAKLTTAERQSLMSTVDRMAKEAVEQISKGGQVDPSEAIRTRIQFQGRAREAHLATGDGP